MGKARTHPATQANVTLDTGALIALARGSGRMIALLRQLAEREGRIHVPSGVVGQAWRDGSRQALLARFLRLRTVEIVVLDGPLARACGELCAASGTADVIDASVALIARRNRSAIVTGDAADLQRLDPLATIVPI